MKTGMNNLKLGVAILILLALGALAGALATKVYVKGKISNFVHGMRPPLTIILKGFLAELELSESQHEEIEKILNQSETRFRELIQKHHPEVEELVDDTMLQIKEKLDREQKEKLDEFSETLKRRRPMRAGPPGMLRKERPEEVLSDMIRRLHLTAEQELEVRPIIESCLEERRHIEEQHREDRQQRFHSFMDKMEALQTSVEERLSTILTPDQMAAYREFNAQHGPPIMHGPPDMHRPPMWPPRKPPAPDAFDKQ